MRNPEPTYPYDEDALDLRGETASSTALTCADPDADQTADPDAGDLGDGLSAGVELPVSAPYQEPDPGQILRDRPDVFAAYYRDFYGALNDRNSSAWIDRVGGETAEDYARYWFRAHGAAEGYQPSSGYAGAPSEELPVDTGCTTIDGIPLSQILADRPDVFRAFFTEYYGANNDRHSNAWVERVGGTTVEDYANYWYNAYGKVSGYRPSNQGSAAPDDGQGSPDDAEPAPSLPPLIPEDPSLDPWNHPAIYPDWQPPYPGWTPPGANAGETGADDPDPFIWSDEGSPMLRPQPTSMFDADPLQ